MNLFELVEVYRTTDPTRIESAKQALASERISCIAHGQHEESSFPVSFLVPPQLVERARQTLARV